MLVDRCIWTLWHLRTVRSQATRIPEPPPRRRRTESGPSSTIAGSPVTHVVASWFKSIFALNRDPTTVTTVTQPIGSWAARVSCSQQQLALRVICWSSPCCFRGPKGHINIRIPHKYDCWCAPRSGPWNQNLNFFCFLRAFGPLYSWGRLSLRVHSSGPNSLPHTNPYVIDF